LERHQIAVDGDLAHEGLPDAPLRERTDEQRAQRPPLTIDAIGPEIGVIAAARKAVVHGCRRRWRIHRTRPIAFHELRRKVAGTIEDQESEWIGAKPGLVPLLTGGVAIDARLQIPAPDQSSGEVGHWSAPF